MLSSIRFIASTLINVIPHLVCGGRLFVWMLSCVMSGISVSGSKSSSSFTAGSGEFTGGYVYYNGRNKYYTTYDVPEGFHVCRNDHRRHSSLSPPSPGNTSSSGDVTSRSTGYFLCPQITNDMDENFCCSGHSDNDQYCCSFWDDSGRKVGVILGIVAVAFIIGLCVYCTYRKKSGSGSSSSSGRRAPPPGAGLPPGFAAFNPVHYRGGGFS